MSDWKNSGETIELPIGQYTIQFSEVIGYLKPVNMNINITKDSTIIRTGVYIKDGIDYCDEGYVHNGYWKY